MYRSCYQNILYFFSRFVFDIIFSKIEYFAYFFYTWNRIEEIENYYVMLDRILHIQKTRTSVGEKKSQLCLNYHSLREVQFSRIQLQYSNVYASITMRK